MLCRFSYRVAKLLGRGEGAARGQEYAAVLTVDVYQLVQNHTLFSSLHGRSELKVVVIHLRVADPD